MQIDLRPLRSTDPPRLCQPDGTKSCGACCGLYNYRGETRAGLERRLVRRTNRFRQLGARTREDLEGFAAWVRSTESQEKMLETIYNCEFLGFLDAEARRVGCLLHPSQHGGEDLRWVSFYGADLCAGHECMSYLQLSREEKWIVILSLDDWYVYGLCITDIDLCRAFLLLASERLGGQPTLPILARPEARSAARSFFELKVSWPFRTLEEGRFGKYWLAEETYREVRIPYDRLGCPRSRYDPILRSLASEFSSRDELREAEELLSRRIDAFVRACTRG